MRLDTPNARVPVLHVAGTNGKGSVSAMVVPRADVERPRHGPLHVASSGASRRALRGERPARRPRGARRGAGPGEGHRSAPAVGGHADRRADVLRSDDGGWVRSCSAQARADLAVVEVGLGGRFDATNVVAPLVTAITSVDFDHQAQLGDDAGGDCRRKGRHDQAWRAAWSSGRCAAEARAVVDDTARALGAPVVRRASKTSASSDRRDGGHFQVTVTTPTRRVRSASTGAGRPSSGGQRGRRGASARGRRDAWRAGDR